MWLHFVDKQIWFNTIKTSCISGDYLHRKRENEAVFLPFPLGDDPATMCALP